MRAAGGEKRCPRCGETKPVSDFSRRAESADGLQLWCKLCSRVAYTQWRLRNMDKARARMAKWRAE